MKKIGIVCLLIIILPINIVHSEPSKHIQLLMDKSLNMFEWGLYQLEKEMESTTKVFLESYNGKNKGDVFYFRNCRVVYDYETNKITISIEIHHRKLDPRCSDLCKKIISRIKFNYALYASNTELTGVGRFFESRLSNQEYDSKDLHGEILDITDINVIVTNNGFKEIFSTKSKLAL